MYLLIKIPTLCASPRSGASVFLWEGERRENTDVTTDE